MNIESFNNIDVNATALHGDVAVGKGTLAKNLAIRLSEMGIPTQHSSSGDVLRAITDDKSDYPAKKEVREVVGDDIQYMYRRELLPAPTMLRMFLVDFAFRVNDMKAKGVILDGWIRSDEQNGFFEMVFNALRNRGNRIYRRDIDLDAPEEVKLTRLTGRNDGRADDGDVQEAIARYHRIKKYTDPMKKNIREFINLGIIESDYHTIDADQSKEKVLEDALKVFICNRNPKMNGHYHLSDGKILVPDRPHIITSRIVGR